MINNIYRPGFASFRGLLSMLAGGFFMVVLVVSFNQEVGEQDVGVKQKSRIVKMKQKPEQIAQKATPKEVREARKASAKAPAPDLGALIGGIPMAIPEFAAAAIGSDSQELLDEIIQDTVMSEGTVDRKPQVTNRPPMEFPLRASNEGVKGFVIVNLLIGEDGRVELAKVIESQPEGIFENTVLSGVREWTFSPASYKGKPVKVWARQRVSFNS
ncbi:MAG: TonB family protein [Desulfobulbales bacterium]|nr:TonB family protein [Desulfobulbales bacterium]